MESIKLSPTVKFGDIFAFFSYLSVYQSQYDKYTIRLYEKEGNSRKITCNFPALVKTLSVLDYNKYVDVYVFGYTKVTSSQSVLLFDIIYDYISDSPIINLY